MASAQLTLYVTKAYLSSVQENLENLRLENAALIQKLNESSISDLTFIYESFEDSFLQVEYFFFPLHISREQVSSCLTLKDGKVISLRD